MRYPFSACRRIDIDSVVGLATFLLILASFPSGPPTGTPSPHSEDPLFEFDCNRNPLREELPTVPIRLEGGAEPVPSGLGLGISIDEKVFARYRVA